MWSRLSQQKLLGCWGGELPEMWVRNRISLATFPSHLADGTDICFSFETQALLILRPDVSSYMNDSLAHLPACGLVQHGLLLALSAWHESVRVYTQPSSHSFWTVGLVFLKWRLVSVSCIMTPPVSSLFLPLFWVPHSRSKSSFLKGFFCGNPSLRPWMARKSGTCQLDLCLGQIGCACYACWALLSGRHCAVYCILSVTPNSILVSL